MCQYSVVRIVREKMLRTEAFSDPEQLQAFLSQLYVFLVDEMHAALNKVRLQNIHQHDLNIEHWCFRVCIISCVSMHSIESELVSGLSGHASWASAELRSTQTLRQRGSTQHGLPAGRAILSGGKALHHFWCFKITLFYYPDHYNTIHSMFFFFFLVVYIIVQFNSDLFV